MAGKIPGCRKKKSPILYGLHEAYYDIIEKIGAITENPVKLSRKTIGDLRHSWMMMAEAYGV